MTTPFANPITGGQGALVRQQIKSPNFDAPTETGWAILKNGQAYFFQITAFGPISSNAGITVGQAGGSEVALNPNAGLAFDVTSAISGFLQAVTQFTSTDTNEVVAGQIGAAVLGTSTSAKMATVLTSAFGGEGAAIILESENDGATDTPVITFGTVTTPDAGSTLVYTPLATIGPYFFLQYAGSSGQTVVTKTSGSGTIPTAGATGGTVKAEGWGPGGGSSGGYGGGVNLGGSSASGGAYSCEPALAAGATVAYVCGVPGAAGPTGTNGSDGTATTITGTSVTVTANPGKGGKSGVSVPGGAASGNTISFPGGAGNSSVAQGGPGGGSGAGTAAAGTAGGNAPGGGEHVGGPGGVAPPGGGSGANGGGASQPGNPGGTPGGGAGGGGEGSVPGAAGGASLVRVSFTTGAPAILSSCAAAAGTDQFGTAYPAGQHYLGPDGNTYSTGRRTLVAAGQLLGTVAAAVTGAAAVPTVAGTYRLHALLTFTNTSTTPTASVTLAGPAVSSMRVKTNWITLGVSGLTVPNQFTSLPSTATSPAFAATGIQALEIDGTVTFSAAGTTFGLTVLQSAGATITLAAGSYVEIEPK